MSGSASLFHYQTQHLHVNLSFLCSVFLTDADQVLNLRPSWFYWCANFVPTWRNLYAGQEATVKTGHGTDWFQIGKGVHQGCILSPCLIILYAEYIMRNAGLDEAKAGIMIARRNINNLRYAGDTTLRTESEKEPLESERREEKSWLKAQHSEK